MMVDQIRRMVSRQLEVFAGDPQQVLARHPVYRYSCPHHHFHTLHSFSRSSFNAYGTLPYQRHRPRTVTLRGFGTMLEPRYIFGASSLDQ